MSSLLVGSCWKNNSSQLSIPIHLGNHNSNSNEGDTTTILAPGSRLELPLMVLDLMPGEKGIRCKIYKSNLLKLQRVRSQLDAFVCSWLIIYPFVAGKRTFGNFFTKVKAKMQEFDQPRSVEEYILSLYPRILILFAIGNRKLVLQTLTTHMLVDHLLHHRPSRIMIQEQPARTTTRQTRQRVGITSHGLIPMPSRTKA
jgi:hypothetical protein